MNENCYREIKKNYLSVLENIQQAAATAGRNPEDVKLVVVTKGHPAETLQAVAEQKNQILYLVETGQPIEQVKLNLEEPMILILGDDQGLLTEHKKEVYTYSVQEVSIGKRSLLGSQVITLVLLELMRRQKHEKTRSS